MMTLTGQLTARRLPWLLLVGWAVGLLGAFVDSSVAGLTAEVWAPLGFGFMLVTVVWDGHGVPGRGAVATLAAMTASFWVVAIAFGHPALDSAQMAVLNSGGAVVMGVVYSRIKTTPGWAPRGARSLGGISAGALVASTAVALLGGFPQDLVSLDTRFTIWWIIRSSVAAFILGATLLTFLAEGRGPSRSSARPSRVGVAVLIPASFVCLFVVYRDPDLPLSWIVLIPAIWAGAMLPPVGAAAHSLMQAIAAAFIALLLGSQFGYEGLLPPSIIIDVLLAGCTFVSLQLSLLRDEREHAIAAEQTLRQAADAQAALLGRIFDSMSDGLLLFDGAGNLVRSNPAARHVFGRPLPLQAASWANYLGLSQEDGAPLHDSELPGAPGLRQHRAIVAIDHAGDRRFLEIASWPISDIDTLALVTDVTSQRQRMAELSRFAGIVSHDLRTPLTSLRGWLEMAREAALDGRVETIEPMLRRAEDASRRMERVIGGWINYTVVREGQLSPERVVLSDEIADVTDALAGTGGRIGTVINIDLPHVVRADRQLTHQLLSNLIGNAEKFTRPDAPAHIEVSSRPDGEPGWIRVDVTDHGLGIPDGEEELIFEEFHRAPEHADDVDGTGLGLSLCRKIVTRHGGSIAAYNNSHGGATISFTLPAA